MALKPYAQVQMVTIPFIRDSLTVKGVNMLLDFRSGSYRMPENYFDLIQPLTSADLLGDSSFAQYVATQLCVSVWKLTTAWDTQTTLRDRYRLKQIVRLRPIPPDLCIICKDVMIAGEMVDSTHCCERNMHTMCL
jgi:hypothetical protein